MHEVLGTPAAASIERPVGASALEETAAAAADALALVRARIADLVVEATELDERAGALALAEAELRRARSELADAATRTAAAAADLDQRERDVSSERDELRARAEALARREELVEETQRALGEQARELDERATRMHWRWLVRAWQWRPPRPRDSARTCGLFFVPSPSGYKLLEHEGVAVTPLARISGLLDERRRYIVTKIAPWPHDGRWCAYLQEDHTAAGGETEDDGDP